MFISKKKFQAEILKVQRETEEKIYQNQRIEEIERRSYEAVDSLRSEFYKNSHITDERLDRLEKAVFCTEIKGIMTEGEIRCGELKFK